MKYLLSCLVCLSTREVKMSWEVPITVVRLLLKLEPACVSNFLQDGAWTYSVMYFCSVPIVTCPFQLDENAFPWEQLKL